MTKRTLYRLIMVFILLPGLLAAGNQFWTHYKETESATRKAEYLFELKETVSKMSVEFEQANQVYSSFLEGWLDAAAGKPVHDRFFTNPEYALSFIKGEYERTGQLQLLTGQLSAIEQEMASFSHPPVEYQSHFAIAAETFAAYKQFVMLAVNPAGTPIAYKQRYDTLYPLIKKKLAEFDASTK